MKSYWDRTLYYSDNEQASLLYWFLENTQLWVARLDHTTNFLAIRYLPFCEISLEFVTSTHHRLLQWDQEIKIETVAIYEDTTARSCRCNKSTFWCLVCNAVCGFSYKNGYHLLATLKNFNTSRDMTPPYHQCTSQTHLSVWTYLWTMKDTLKS